MSWPLRKLILRTQRLELRPDDDAGLDELNDLAAAGIHEPEYMPFAIPWTDAPTEQMSLRALQFRWQLRAELCPEKWTVSFLVRMNGVVVGCQDLIAKDFAANRTVSSGSWLGAKYQGMGLGKEMRAAIMLLAFDHLGARRAETGAWHDNAPSIGVSRALGYRQQRSTMQRRRGERTRMLMFQLDPEDFVRPQWTLKVDGLDACRPLFGAG